MSEKRRLLTDSSTTCLPSFDCSGRVGATTPANLNITHPTILDQLKANGLTYKQYTESYPGGCYLPDMYPDDKVTALYYKRHSSFNMISDLRGIPECLSAIGT
ncbi:hypothetical protein K457DRAFT_25338 [Linnemannia elongata AG-77]|uniref:Uncharacterized protein n=1 Tax=Linnemannia elongata AG-77 TaxID=1314771 RepID=A0A197JDC9_9FUNG|nr:hypothetical protein K457DRAFT_25338 [Linnemannia elongata AG-77]